MDNPAPEGQNSVIMINMNCANIQMNMGDFRGSDVAEDDEGDSWSFVQGIQETDKDAIVELLQNQDFQAGLKTLTEKLPGFSSFVDAMVGTTEAPATTEAADSGAGMGR